MMTHWRAGINNAASLYSISFHIPDRPDLLFWQRHLAQASEFFILTEQFFRQITYQFKFYPLPQSPACCRILS